MVVWVLCRYSEGGGKRGVLIAVESVLVWTPLLL